MARITIEDCMHPGVENQFELVLIAAKRARRLANGADALVEWENDKPTVVALREIAEGKINRDLLLEADPEPAPTVPAQDSALALPPDFRAPQFGLGD